MEDVFDEHNDVNYGKLRAVDKFEEQQVQWEKQIELLKIARGRNKGRPMMGKAVPVIKVEPEAEQEELKLMMKKSSHRKIGIDCLSPSSAKEPVPAAPKRRLESLKSVSRLNSMTNNSQMISYRSSDKGAAELEDARTAPQTAPVSSGMRSRQTSVSYLHKREDLQKRLKFYYQELNQSHKVLTPTSPTSPKNNLWAIENSSSFHKKLCEKINPRVQTSRGGRHQLIIPKHLNTEHELNTKTTD